MDKQHQPNVDVDEPSEKRSEKKKKTKKTWCCCFLLSPKTHVLAGQRIPFPFRLLTLKAPKDPNIPSLSSGRPSKPRRTKGTRWSWTGQEPRATWKTLLLDISLVAYLLPIVRKYLNNLKHLVLSVNRKDDQTILTSVVCNCQLDTSFEQVKVTAVMEPMMQFLWESDPLKMNHPALCALRKRSSTCWNTVFEAPKKPKTGEAATDRVSPQKYQSNKGVGAAAGEFFLF